MVLGGLMGILFSRRMWQIMFNVAMGSTIYVLIEAQYASARAWVRVFINFNNKAYNTYIQKPHALLLLMKRRFTHVQQPN